MEKLREATVDNWNLAIEDALDFRLKYGREQDWARCEALFYQCHQKQAGNVGANIISSTGDALVSTLLVPNPYYVLKALRQDTVDSVPTLESVLNGFIYALDMKDSTEQSGLHGYLYGRGILKIGYDSEYGYDPRNDLGFEHNQIFGMSLSQFDKKGQKIEYNSVTPGMPWVAPVLPHDFIVPWGTGPNLRTAPWCGHRIVRHIDDIKADPKYENKKDLRPTLSMSDFVKSYTTVMKPYRMGAPTASSTSRREGSDSLEFVEMWELHDVRTGRVYVLAQDHKRFLRNEIDYLQEDGLPFVSFNFVPAARTFWTTPDVVYLQSTQDEVMDITEMQRKQRRISLLRFMYEENIMDSDELEKFMSGKIGAGIKYKPGGTSRTPIIPFTPSNSNNVLQQESEAVRRDARETVGFSRNQMGEYEGSGRRTASEAMIVQQNADQRLNRRQQIIANTYIELGKKLSKIVFKFWRTPRLTEIIGPDGAALWSSFTGSALKGEYQFKVGFSNEPVEGLKARQQKAMSLFQFLSQDPSIDQMELRRYLSRAFNDPEFTRLFLPGVINNANLQLPMQQMQQQMGGDNTQGNGGGGGTQATMPGVQVAQQRSAVQRQSGELAAVGPQ